MRIVELTRDEFNNFASIHPLRNYCQNDKYANFMSEKGYNYEYIGYRDDSNILVAAALILNKKLGTSKYAYVPKGVLIDYYNSELTEMFFKALSDYYKKKKYAFLKINPEIIIGELDINNNFVSNYNQNVSIIDLLKNIGFKRRREVKPLDMLFPRLNPYIDLKNFDFDSLEEDTRDKINLSRDKGLYLEAATIKDVSEFYNYIKNNTYENVSFYKNILNYYGDDAEMYLLKINYEEYLISARNKYNNELENNNYWNELIQNNSEEKNINSKMKSDRDLLTFKNEIVVATEGLRMNKIKTIGGFLILKYENRVSVVAMETNKDIPELSAKYFMVDYLINKYKEEFDFLDLNGLASVFNDDSQYSMFNEVKIAFKPIIYEFIGEFDLIISDFAFKKIQSKNYLTSEFNPSYKFDKD